MVYFYHHSMQQPPAFPQHMEHFKPQMMNMSQDLSQQVVSSSSFLTSQAVLQHIHLFLNACTLKLLYMHNIYYSCLFQVPLPPNGQLQAYGLPPGQGFPVMMPPMGHALPGQPLPGSTGPPGFLGGYLPHNAAQQQQVNLKIVQSICKIVASNKPFVG